MSFGTRHIKGPDQRLAALAKTLAESTGYANLELLAALLKSNPKEHLQTVENNGVTAIAFSVAKARLPLAATQSWITPLTASGRPAIAQNTPPEAWACLAQNQRRPHIFLEIPRLSHACPALSHACPHVAITSSWQRAALHCTGSFDTWLAENFDHKRRKELKRLRARLSEQGVLASERLDAATLASFTDDFLRLESAGWKGDRGSALAQDGTLTAALREGLWALQAAGKLRFWRITLDGKAIAALFAIVECGTATLGKIAYDEAFAKYSPGVLVILDATADFFADPAITLADSNAIPDHPMINRIWRDRIDMVNIAVAGPSCSAARFRATLMAERLRAALRKQVKNAYLRFKGKSK